MDTLDVISKAISGVKTSSGIVFAYNFTGFISSSQQQGKIQPECIREAYGNWFHECISEQIHALNGIESISGNNFWMFFCQLH